MRSLTPITDGMNSIPLAHRETTLKESSNLPGNTNTHLITMVHMGDSITFGQYVDPTVRWTSLVADRLSEMYRDIPIHIVSLNRGVSGETTRMGLERFPDDVQVSNPDIVTLQYGLNDCNCWLTDRGLPRVSETAFRANLIEMVTRARQFGANHVILANNHPTLRHKEMLSGEKFEDANARYGQITYDVALESGATFCDIRKGFEAYVLHELEKLLMPGPDWLHLSVKGNRVYSEIMWPLVRDAAIEETGIGASRTIS